MTIARETLSAYVDGELAAAEAHLVERAIAQDSELASYVEQQRALRSHLTVAFAPVITAPVPEHLERMVMESPAPTAPRRRTFAWPSLRLRPVAISAGAFATGVVVAIVFMNAIQPASVIGNQNGVLMAEGSLAKVLSNELASEQAGGAQNRIGVTFRNKTGEYCRSFNANGGKADALAGIACRDNSQWRIVVLAAAAAVDATKFQPAAATMPETVRAALDEMISGAPLDAAGEREARERNWRAP